MICEQCAQMPACPPEVLGAYGRACWLAFGQDAPEPDCGQFVERGERYWRGEEWRRPRGRVRIVRREARHGRRGV